MKDTINKVLRDKGIIDNGVSDILARVCGEMTYNVIREEISFAGIATAALQGILAEGVYTTREEAASEAIEAAEALHNKLYKRLDLLETPTDPTIQ